MVLKPRTTNKTDHTGLWWVAIIALGISISVYILMGKQAEIDVAAEQTRLLFPLIGIIIAGICFICGISKKWFSKQ